jgi:hypothetical protein
MKFIKNPFLVFFSFAIILFNSCMSQNSLFESKKNIQIIFGSGGGFTGKIMEYTLHENGDIFLNNTLKNNNNKIKTLSGVETKEVFSKLKSIDLNNIKFNHPGNMYYFIKVKSKKSLHEVIWGDNRYTTPNEVKDFYKFLMTKIH